MSSRGEAAPDKPGSARRSSDARSATSSSARTSAYDAGSEHSGTEEYDVPPPPSRGEDEAEFEGKEAEARERRRDYAADSAEELLALEEEFDLAERHLRKFRKAFDKLDRHACGRVPRREVLEWLREPFSSFSDKIFELVEVEGAEEVRFCEFVRTLSTVALFGRLDVLRFCFFAFDANKNGFIDHGELHELVQMLHSDDRYQVMNVDGMLRKFDLDRDGRINFEEFQNINRSHPYLLYPAFRLQVRIETKTMGRRWWYSKRRSLARKRSRAAAEGSRVLLDGPVFLGDVKQAAGSLRDLLVSFSPAYRSFLDRLGQGSGGVARMARKMSSGSLREDMRAAAALEAEAEAAVAEQLGASDDDADGVRVVGVEGKEGDPRDEGEPSGGESSSRKRKGSTGSWPGVVEAL